MDGPYSGHRFLSSGDDMYDAAPDFQVDAFSATPFSVDMNAFGQLDGLTHAQSFHDPRLQFDFDAMALSGHTLDDLAFDAHGMGPDFGSDLTTPMSPISPLSPVIVSPMENAFEDFPDMQSLSMNAHAHAAPWSASIPRSDPSGSTAYLQIPGRVGQPRHEFMQSAYSQSFGGFSFADSGYVSTAPADTISLVSAPSAMMFAPDDSSEIMEPPVKRIRKPFRCDESGEHRTRDFANIHDLERHQRSAHGMQPTHSQPYYYKCCVEGCKARTKPWDRKDNFRNHLTRRHFDNDASDKAKIDELVERSKCTLTAQQVRESFYSKQSAKYDSKMTKQRKQARRTSRAVSNDRPVTGLVSPATSVAEDAEYMLHQVHPVEMDLTMAHTNNDHAATGSIGFASETQSLGPLPTMSTEHDMW